MKILTVIPARGGSRGIPKKNIRFIAGQPLLAYAIQCAKASTYDMDVVVTSDEEEIQNIARRYGTYIIERPANLAGDSVTLDPVIDHAVTVMESLMQCNYDIVITMQPTSPLLSVETLDAAIDFFIKNEYDTVLSGVNDPRLSWRVENGQYVPNYTERLNRQYLPKELKETGAFVITKRVCITSESRLGNKISVFEVPERESGDIDTPQDWLIAQHELERKRIVIRLEGYPQIGLGHIYRGLRLAESFIEHDVLFIISAKSKLGIQKLEQSHYPYQVITDEEDFFAYLTETPVDIVINDILDTDIAYMQRLNNFGAKIINFEDMGEGRRLADAVINALYEKEEEESNVYWGDKYYLIRDEFLLESPRNFRDKVQEILVIFGGTDPNDLTDKTVRAIMKLSAEQDLHCMIILGMGYQNADKIRNLVSSMPDQFDVIQDVKMMTQYMSKADIAVSSQGRTMLELVSMKVPTILMAQNEREMTHVFGSLENGFLNLGIGMTVETDTIYETLRWLIHCPSVRRNMWEQMSKKDLTHGMDRVKQIIMEKSKK